MDDNISHFPERTPISIVGARRPGCSVFLPTNDPSVSAVPPHLWCYADGDMITIGVGHHAFDFPKEWAYLAAELAAHAMAVQAGLDHRDDSLNGRPFCRRAMKISDSLLPTSPG